MDHGRERRTHSMGSCVRAGGGLRGVGGAPDARAGGSVGGATPRAGSRRARGARRGARRRRREKRRREKRRRRNLHRDLREKREGEHTRAILRRRDSSRGGHGRFRVGTETHAETDVGLGDRLGGAAVQRGRRVGAFRPTRARASAPIREDAFLSAAESAAAEAARLGPSARELYYASYKAAMQEATASLNRSDASAVLAAAAGAARSVRGASSEGASAGPSPSRVEPSPNPARRRADAALARRRAASGTAGPLGASAPGDGVRASTREAYARARARRGFRREPKFGRG